MTYTKDVTDPLAIRAIYAIDVYAEDNDLSSEAIPLETKLTTLGFGPQKCDILSAIVNNIRRKRGVGRLKSGAIKPGTTIQGIIDLVSEMPK